MADLDADIPALSTSPFARAYNQLFEFACHDGIYAIALFLHGARSEENCSRGPLNGPQVEEHVMTVSGLFRWVCAGIVSVSIAACSSGENKAAAPAAAPAASAPASVAANADNACPLTVDQVAAVTGAPMTLPPGGCTFFPANGRDIPHVFYVLQSPMVCTSIKPSDLGFTETVDGLSAPAAFVRDQIDGSHVLVCRDNARAFDIVVDIKNDKPKNREAAIALAKQVLAGH